ncbi:MAG: hypothetical protein HC843_11605 [Sphingomonadales bacterium]|nr:hypothetical protein [Sphingomonadales bacterium]
MAQIAGGSQSLAAASVKYQELQLNADFSNKQLGIAMASLQEAKDESERKQAYVDRIASPSLSDYPSAPKRIRSIFATIILGFLVWGVLSMLIVGIREHRD